MRDITDIDQAFMFGKQLGLKEKVINEILLHEKPNVGAHVMVVRSKENAQSDTETLTILNEALLQLRMQGDIKTCFKQVESVFSIGVGEQHSLSRCTPSNTGVDINRKSCG